MVIIIIIIITVNIIIIIKKVSFLIISVNSNLSNCLLAWKIQDSKIQLHPSVAS